MDEWIKGNLEYEVVISKNYALIYNCVGISQSI